MIAAHRFHHTYLETVVAAQAALMGATARSIWRGQSNRLGLQAIKARHTGFALAIAVIAAGPVAGKAENTLPVGTVCEAGTYVLRQGNPTWQHR